MTSVFVYEFITAGGTLVSLDETPHGTLLREGTAMLTSVCGDLSRLEDVSTSILWDARIPAIELPVAHREIVSSVEQHWKSVDRLLQSADVVLLIAPEFDGHLIELCRRARKLEAKLVSPDERFVRLATDKCATAELLRAASIPVPKTYRCRRPANLASFPPTEQWVIKPVDGAGSIGLRVGTVGQLQEFLTGEADYCVQPAVPGRPASVSALCGGRQFDLLPPCWQILEAETFAYLGGATICQPELVARAHRLAARTLQALPATVGFVGVDMVLGAEESADWVLEVNPRLTSSYVGLTQITRPNLASAMIDRALGADPQLSFPSQPLEFRL